MNRPEVMNNTYKEGTIAYQLHQWALALEAKNRNMYSDHCEYMRRKDKIIVERGHELKKMTDTLHEANQVIIERTEQRDESRQKLANLRAAIARAL